MSLSLSIYTFARYFCYLLCILMWRRHKQVRTHTHAHENRFIFCDVSHQACHQSGRLSVSLHLFVCGVFLIKIYLPLCLSLRIRFIPYVMFGFAVCVLKQWAGDWDPRAKGETWFSNLVMWPCQRSCSHGTGVTWVNMRQISYWTSFWGLFFFF